MDFSVILDFVKKAIAALLKLLGIEADEEFADNIESAFEDVKNFGDAAAAE